MTSKTIVGRIGRVPELRDANGKPVAKFSVAETKRKFDREQNQWVDDFTIWHDVEAWKFPEQLAQLAQGTLVIVVGEERDGTYVSRETNKKVPKIFVRASEVGVLVTGQSQASAPVVANEPWSTPTSSTDTWGEATF